MPRIHREVATLMKNLKSQFDGQVKLKESTFDFESEDDVVLTFSSVQMMGSTRTAR